jgi:hypothetical protein
VLGLLLILNGVSWPQSVVASLLDAVCLDMAMAMALLQSFLKLFKQVFQLATRTTGNNNSSHSNITSDINEADTAARNALFCEKLLELVHGAVSRAVFNKDQLAAAVHLARNVFSEQFPEDEWMAFLSCSGNAAVGAGDAIGSAAADASNAAVAAKPSWMGSAEAAAYEQLVSLLPHLAAAAQLHEARLWAPWASAEHLGSGNSSSGRLELVPPAAASRLTLLQQLILVAAFKPERCRQANTEMS